MLHHALHDPMFWIIIAGGVAAIGTFSWLWVVIINDIFGINIREE